MKNLTKFLGIIAIGVIIWFSLAGCEDKGDDNTNNGGDNPTPSGGGTTLSGTYVLDSDYFYITFSGNTFTGFYGGEQISGTYTVSNNTVTLTIQGYGTETMTIVNSTTLRDSDGDDWIKSGGGGKGGTAPNAPTGVKATANSSSSITVTWNSVSNATGYYIYRSSSSSGTYSQIGTSTSTSYQNNGLSANTIYYYKVAAYNSNGTSSQSSYTSATTQSSGGGTAPSAPTGVTASRNSENSTTVTVSWNAVSGATGYKVYYSSSGSGSGNLEGSPSTTSFESTGNSTTGTHYFRVSAENSVGEGSPSSWVSVGPVSGGGGTAPSAPTGVKATAQSSSSIRIQWNSVSGATGYYIYRSPTASGTYAQVGTESSTSYTNTGLSANTTYYYKVAAYNGNGEGSQSSYDYATTQSSGGGNTAVTFNSLTANGSSSQTTTELTLTFSQVITGLSASDITLSGVSGVSKGTLISGLAPTYTLTISGFSAGGTLSVAVSKTGYTVSGTPKTITIFYNLPLPNAPYGITIKSAQTTRTSLTVEWGAANGATGYKLYRSTSEDGPYTVVYTGSSTTRTDTGLSPNTMYYYKVTATNSSGESDFNFLGVVSGWTSP